MTRIITEELINEACASRITAIQEATKSTLSSVQEELCSLEERNNNAIQKAKFSKNAIVPFDKIDYSDCSSILPEGLNIGRLKHPVSNQEFFPAVLPFAHSCATAFCVDSAHEKSITDLMQLLAIRLLLCLPLELAKVHFVDLFSFGKYTKYFGRLSGRIKDEALVSTKEELTALVSELESIVAEINHEVLIDAKDLRDYNSCTETEKIPYHFVFCPCIHDRIDNSLIARLFSLCNGMNAANCGVYLFYSVENYEQLTNSDALKCLIDTSLRVTLKDNCYVYSNSEYGKLFEDKYRISQLEAIPESFNKAITEINLRDYNDRLKDVKETWLKDLYLYLEKTKNKDIGKVSFEPWLEKLVSSKDEFWSGCSTKGLKIPIGVSESGLVCFSLAGGTADNFAMIGGRPGYGKTILLHDIICNASLIYSPTELSLYLIDCTNGTGFKPYETLPHARFVSITNQRAFTKSAIDHLSDEMVRRSNLFKRASEEHESLIDDISLYRSTCSEVLPRILVIIDEFQVLFERKDTFSTSIKVAIEKIIKEGRKYGIHIVLCTQSYKDIDLNTELITLRIAFNLKEYDSQKVLGGIGNDAATHLGIGEAVLNNHSGDKFENVFFRSAYIKESIPRYVSLCAKQWNLCSGEKDKRYVINGDSLGNVGNNELFVTSMMQKDTRSISCFVGVPMFIRDTHAYFTFRRAIGSNLIICGTDSNAALSTIALVNYQISGHFDTDVLESHAFMFDFFPESSPQSNYLKSISREIGICYGNKRDFESQIDALMGVLKSRMDNTNAGIIVDDKPYFGTIAYLQSIPDNMKKDNLRRVSQAIAKFQYLLKNGPDYGIHFLCYSHNYKGLLDDVIDQSYLSTFGNRILLQGGALGPQDIQSIETLSEGTAFLITEENVTTHKMDNILMYNYVTPQKDEPVNPVLKSIFSIYQ